MYSQDLKRKRGQTDASKMKADALLHLGDFKAELEGIEDNEGELKNISSHVSALECILRGGKRPRLNFSDVKFQDLEKVGVRRKLLAFDDSKVTNLTEGLTESAKTEIMDLRLRLKKIYARVNMDAGSRMVLEAVLLAVAEIVSNEQRGVVIVPGMKIARDGVSIIHPDSGEEVWLDGTINYAVVEFEDVKDNKARLLGPGGSRGVDLRIGKGHLFLIEAKRRSPEYNLLDHVPEAVSQAIALLKSARLQEVRLCLSDGQSWIFFLARMENKMPVYYESIQYFLTRDSLENSDQRLREIVQLMCQWLRPTKPGLYELDESE